MFLKYLGMTLTAEVKVIVIFYKQTKVVSNFNLHCNAGTVACNHNGIFILTFSLAVYAGVNLSTDKIENIKYQIRALLFHQSSPDLQK